MRQLFRKLLIKYLFCFFISKALNHIKIISVLRIYVKRILLYKVKTFKQKPEGLNLVGVTGLEPTTSCSLSKHSSHLSYTPMISLTLENLVGVAGLEPTASCSRSRHSTT